jgi:transposase
VAKGEQIPQTDPAEIEHLIERLKQQQLNRQDEDLIERLLRLVLVLVELLQYKNVSIKRLRKLVFGPRTEKRKVAGQTQGEEKKEASGAEAQSSEMKERSQAQSEAGEGSAKDQKGVAKGHGRKAASAIPGAREVICRHEQYKAGDQCPENGCRGRLYVMKTPNSFIQFTGRPLIEATTSRREVLRCAACQERYEAALPEGVVEEKYAATADATIALMKYGGGLPWYRQARMQESCGVPLSESVQWERCEAVANAALPVFLLLERLGADGEVLYTDDTGVKILAWEKEKQKLSEKERRGTQTSGIVVEIGGRKLALYTSGKKHAGENTDELLAGRSAGLPVPIQMSDALAANQKGKEKRIWAKCLAHARRKFYELEGLFPEPCRVVLEALGEVYKFEGETKGMSAEDRLKYHQEKSGPVMSELKEWIQGQQREKQVEPNSALGEARRYSLRHWEGLTKFLSVPQAPLDNNEAERAWKRCVLLRKNSLFFKTEHGAAVGSMILSLIESCRLNGVNPWAYLVCLRKNAAAVRRNPAQFLPWSYAEADCEPRAA